MNALSYVNGLAQTPLIGKTLGQCFDDACVQYGDKTALIDCGQDVRLSYTELQKQVNTFACSLLRLGLEKGDRIGIWSPNCFQWTITQLAAHKLGLILVNINPSYRQHELAYALNKVSCRAIVTATTFKTSNYLQMLYELIPELSHCQAGKLLSTKCPILQYVIQLGKDKQDGMLSFTELLAIKATESELNEMQDKMQALQFDEPINIQFTSGTTGSPKGATLTHHNILNNGYYVGEVLKLTEEDKVCVPVPLYHCVGMVLGNLACIAHGSCVVYPSPAFDVDLMLKSIESEKCTALYGVPTMFISALAHPDFDNLDLSSLRTGIMAGSPCPEEVMKKVIEKMNVSEITICYGMTETSPVSFQTLVDDPFEKRITTVGRIHPHCEGKIIDLDGQIVAVGEMGELCVRGYLVMLGYWANEEKTAEVFDRAGWMHTGDIAVFDQQGYCSIVGRIKDMVIRGGENLYPREIEEFLYQYPNIVEVQVVGVADKKYGEELCAWIILKAGSNDTEDDIRQFCEERISKQKIPRYIKFVDKFPMTVTGKIKKFMMREIAEKEIEDQA